MEGYAVKGKFLYAKGVASRDALSSIGYTLLKSDEVNHIYIFENKGLPVSLYEKTCVVASDTLAF